VGDDLAIVAPDFKRPNAMKDAPAGRPEFDLLNQTKKGDLLTVVNRFWRLLCHGVYDGTNAQRDVPFKWRGVRELHPATQI
jgi:hypothetical protein